MAKRSTEPQIKIDWTNPRWHEIRARHVGRLAEGLDAASLAKLESYVLELWRKQWKRRGRATLEEIAGKLDAWDGTDAIEMAIDLLEELAVVPRIDDEYGQNCSDPAKVKAVAEVLELELARAHDGAAMLRAVVRTLGVDADNLLDFERGRRRKLRAV